LNFGFSYYPAIFDVEATSGLLITVMNGPDATLTGSNGGTLTLKLGASNPASPFVSTADPPYRKSVSIGGTLSMGSLSPPGTYNGTFSVTFNYQ
jgi:hypothetical protein